MKQYRTHLFHATAAFFAVAAGVGCSGGSGINKSGSDQEVAFWDAIVDVDVHNGNILRAEAGVWGGAISTQPIREGESFRFRTTVVPELFPEGERKVHFACGFANAADAGFEWSDLMGLIWVRNFGESTVAATAFEPSVDKRRVRSREAFFLNSFETAEFEIRRENGGLRYFFGIPTISPDTEQEILLEDAQEELPAELFPRCTIWQSQLVVSVVENDSGLVCEKPDGESPGESCDDATVIEPTTQTIVADLRGAVDDLTAASEFCGTHGSDHVYRFHTNEAVLLRAQSEGSAGDTQLYLREGEGRCDDGAAEIRCGAYHDPIDPTARFLSGVLDAELKADTTYYLVVDGDGGFYELSLLFDRITHPAGETCEDARTIEPVTQKILADMHDASDDLAAATEFCGDGGGDHVYRFHTEEAVVLRALSDSRTGDMQLYLREGEGRCADDTAEIRCGVFSGLRIGFLAGVVEAELKADTTYYLVVDAASGVYELSLLFDRITHPAGETCEDARTIEPVTQTIVADLHDASDDLTVETETCRSVGGDHVYRFHTQEAAVLRARSESRTGDMHLYLWEGEGRCGDATAEIRCEIADSVDTGLSIGVADAELKADTTYYLVVDAESDAYELSLQFDRVEDPAGETCESARTIEPVTQTLVADLHGASDDMTTASEVCGLDGGDHVYRFRTEEAVVLRARAVGAIGETHMYLRAGEGRCGEDAAEISCGSDIDRTIFGAVNAALTADTTYYLVVDGQTGVYELSLEFEQINHPPGETCEDARRIEPVNQTIVADTRVASDDVAAASEDCGAPGLGDHVYQFHTDEAVVLRAQAVGPKTSVDTFMYLREGEGRCDDPAAEISCGRDFSRLNVGLAVAGVVGAELKADTTYYLVVEVEGGVYDLSLEFDRVEHRPGETCDDALTIEPVTQSIVADLGSASDGVAAETEFCGPVGNDHVYRFHTEEAVVLRARAEGFTEHLLVSLREGEGRCQDDSAQIACGEEFSLQLHAGVSDAQLKADTTYYLAVEGAGAYELDLSFVSDTVCFPASE